MIYNPYPQVDLPFGKDNKYFKILFDAICKVDQSYVNYQIINPSYPQETSPDIQEHVERVFAYELYHRWANLLDENGIKNLVLNGEINKSIISGSQYASILINQDKEHSIFPDLVLHASQENDNNQLMICEIKREKGLDDKDLLHDLYKLNKYINKEDKGFVWAKPFRYGIFILVGSSVSLGNLTELKHDTQTKFLNDDKTWGNFQASHADCSPRIVCITYDGIRLEYDTLDNMYPELKQSKTDSNPDISDGTPRPHRRTRSKSKREVP